MECNKYINKAKIGVLLLLSIILPVEFKNYFDSGLLKLMGLVYIVVVSTIGIKYILQYVNCIIDYNRRNKPPFIK